MRRKKERDKLLVKCILIIGMVLLFSSILLSPLLAKERLGKIGSGGTKGSWFVFATGFSEYLRKHSDINLTVVPSSGGMEGFKNVMSRKVDFGFIHSSVAYQAWNGLPPFKEKNHDFRSIGIVAPASICHFVVLKESDIRSIYDLKGKAFSPGPVGTSTYIQVTGALKDLGLSDKIKIVNISHSEQITYLVDKKIDGYALMGGPPVPSISEVATMKPIRLLDMRVAFGEIDFFKTHPFFIETKIPKGVYHGVKYDVSSFGVNDVFLVHKDVDEKMVREVTKLLFSADGIKYLKTVHRSLVGMEVPNPTKGLVVPVHPGAEKAWKEKGISIGAPSL